MEVRDDGEIRGFTPIVHSPIPSSSPDYEERKTNAIDI